MADLNDSGFWQRFWSRFSGRTRLDDGERAVPFESHTTPSGSVVGADSSLKLSAVWACVRLRAQTVASLPLHLRGEDKSHAKEHPLYRLLHSSPNADMTASEFWESQLASLDLWGNAFSHIVWIGRRVTALVPLNPEKMTVRRTSSGKLVYEYTKGGNVKEYAEEEILHLKGFTLDGLMGLSPIQFAAETLGGLMDANKAATREFQNGLKVGGFLKTGVATLAQEQRDRLRAGLSTFGLPENAGKWMVLEAGMEPASAQGIRINPVDAQLLESRYFGIEEICRAFGVPPQLVGHTNKASSWASSLEQTNMGFLTYSLRPTLVRIEQAIAKKLLLPEERGLYRPKFAVEGLLRADSAARSSFYSQMLQNGVMSRNEVRALEDFPPVEGADALTAQLNLTTIDKIGAPEEPK
ncbi:MAG TPA: phage portal protein [Pseudomonas sp.]|jgi:HK97 family phage portal protein|uniref:phage portal protein n=1 Tax=Pseudomonas sp. G.S.17 TaxID=3137451 RepID=UPI002EEDD019